MANGELEEQNLGAPKISEDLESQIRNDSEREYTHLTTFEKEALIRSRLKISLPKLRPSLVKVDIGESASKKIKDDLFE